MATFITMIFGKPVRELVADETIKNSVMEGLDEICHHILNDSLESEQSINVSYNLLQNNLGKEHHSKTGWSNPVRKKYIGIETV